MNIRGISDSAVGSVVETTNRQAVDLTNTPAADQISNDGSSRIASEDKVDISAAAKSLQTSSSAFDESKVNAVKKALADGTYQIHAQQIAEKMIDASSEIVERLARVDPNRR
jgi:negative regulator of flagellin synthesis FlgM